MKIFNINKILVPVDFSGSSLNALETAMMMAKIHKAEIILLHVINAEFTINNRFDLFDVSLFNTNLKSSCSLKEMDELFNKVSCDNEIKITPLVMKGNEPQVICNVAQLQSVDLIIMGTHGTSQMKEYLMGSVSFRVIRNALCPVMVIPPYNKWLNFSKILFPVRDVPGIIEKYCFTKKIIVVENSELMVVGLNEEKNPEGFPNILLHINNIHKLLEDDCINFRIKLYTGKRSGEEVLRISEDFNMDLIVITAVENYNPLEYFSIPFMQQVINNTRLPVLAFRPSKALYSSSN